jgi:hypothetical protein
MASKTITTTSTLTYDDTKVDLLAVATVLGYQTVVEDPTKLNADGTVPMVQAKDDTGALLWEQELTGEEANGDPIYSDKLDADGNKIPQMIAVDVTMPNPQTPEEFITEQHNLESNENLANKVTNAMFKVKELELQALKVATKEAIKSGITNT